jgi:hypothetical protein
MCRIKKKNEPTVITIEATNQLQKGYKNNLNSCHICGLMGTR